MSRWRVVCDDAMGGSLLGDVEARTIYPSEALAEAWAAAYRDSDPKTEVTVECLDDEDPRVARAETLCDCWPDGTAVR